MKKFTDEEKEQFQEQIEALQAEVLEKYKQENPFTIQKAMELLNKEGGKAFVNEQAFVNAAKATIGNFDANNRKAIKKVTGISWNDGEGYEDYVDRATKTFAEEQAVKTSSSSKHEFEALKTSLNKTEQEKENLKNRLQELETEQFNRKKKELMFKPIEDKQFKVPDGLDEATKKQYIDFQKEQYKKNFEQNFEVLQEDDKVFLKDKQGNTFADVQKAVDEWLPKSGLQFADSSKEKGTTSLFLRSQDGKPNREALAVARQKATQAILDKGLYPHQKSDPQVQEIIQEHGLEEYGLMDNKKEGK